MWKIRVEILFEMLVWLEEVVKGAGCRLAGCPAVRWLDFDVLDHFLENFVQILTIFKRF